MAPACQLCGWRVQKRDSGLCPPFCLGESCPPALTSIPDTSVPPCRPLVPSKLPSQCWSSEGMILSKSVFEFFKRNCLGLQKCLPLNQSLLVLQPEVMGTYLPGTGTLGWGTCCEAGDPCSQDTPPEFLSITCRCGTILFCISVPPTSLDGCGFFNSVVVRLPFNLISGSE